MGYGILLGGGAALNYSYAAYANVGSLPASADENHLGFLTSVAITELQIRRDRPTTRADGSALSGGEMWLKSNTNSNRPFNALKAESLLVYPLSTCQQYVSGSWVDKDVRIYQSGWQTINVVFYDGGDVAAVTGGWTAGDTGAYLYITASNGGASSVMSDNNLYDFSKIQTLRLLGAFYSSYDVIGKVYLSTTKNTSGAVASLELNTNSGDGTTVTDVAWNVDAYNGSYYIVFYITTNVGVANVCSIRVDTLTGY